MSKPINTSTVLMLTFKFASNKRDITSIRYSMATWESAIEMHFITKDSLKI